MSQFLCSPPGWTDGHVSNCIERSYLELVIPAAAILASLLILGLYTFRCRQDPVVARGFQPVAADDDDEDLEDFVLKHPQVHLARHFQWIEAGILALDLSGGAVLAFNGDELAPGGTLFLSAFLFTLVNVRMLSASHLGLTVRSHSEILYCVQWICLFFITHKFLVTEAGGFEFWVTVGRLCLFTTLILFHWTAPHVSHTGHSGSWAGSVDGDDLGRDERASFLAQLFFSWLEPLLWKAFKAGPLDSSVDLYPLNSRISAAAVVPEFRMRDDAATSFLWKVFHFLKWDLLRQGAWAALTGVLVFVPPVLIKLILEYLAAGRFNASTALLHVLGLFAANITASMSDCQCGWIGFKLGAKLRTVLFDQVYGKVMRRRMVGSSSSSHDADPARETKFTSDGAIFNFVSGDVDFISTMSGSVYLVWVTFPVQITIGTCLLYQIMGISGVLGVVLMIALLPLNVMVSKRLAAAQGQLLGASDARIQASNDLFGAIHTINFYSWESHFRRRVLEKRQAELQIMRKRFLWWSISMTVFYTLPFVVTILTCFFYTIVWNGRLHTSIAFPALATFAVLRIPLNRLADSITFLIQAHVSLVRVTKFLEEPETEKEFQISCNTDQSLIGFKHANLTWPVGKLQAGSSSEDSTPVGELPPPAGFRLENLNISFRKDGLNIICGPNGSGKTAVLLALLGELHLGQGQVGLHNNTKSRKDSLQGGIHDLEESAAYCPHEPWVTNQSVRANILLETPFHLSRYEEVLQAVALNQDLAAFSDGDMTSAGENGSRLSGGQKQRISLARALYSTSKYVLLDDCLSALDSRTAKHIFFNAIKGPLMKGRTCILATHHTQLAVPHSDYTVVLDSGKVKAQGPPTDIFLRSNFDIGRDQEKATAVNTLLVDESDIDDESGTPPKETAAPSSKDIKEESKSGEGSVAWSVVRGYLADMGQSWFWSIVLAVFAAQQFVSLGTNLWMKVWAKQYDSLAETEVPKENPADVPAAYYLLVYISICVAYAVVTLLRNLVTFSGSLKASFAIYERLLNRVTSAKISFFERPLGQITNRFSKDISVVDQSLASFSVSALQIVATVAMVVILMFWAVPNIFLVLVLGVVCIAYYYTTALYLQSAQDLKRIEASSRSPLYQQVGETISGYVSIRAYGREALFSAKHRRLVDGLNQPYLLLAGSKQWLTMRVGILSSVITLVTSSFVILRASSIDVGVAGLVLTYAATFTENMLWFIQIYAIIQQSLTSVERIVEYTTIEQEAIEPNHTSTTRPSHLLEPPGTWPSRGHVQFSNFTARYAPNLNPALRSISFEAKPGERIAVVGRTGAGKSSIALALLRVLEGDFGPGGGRIEIDGINISDVKLPTLRGKALSIIPQDPQLFSGSMRDNIDPLGQHMDAEILTVLRSMQHHEKAQDMDLDAPASGLSRGQSQMLCVARGLLRRTRVLVLDEATANVDHAADKAIQSGLKSFVAEGNTTVITIAHRLLTIAEYDRVLVLDEGRIVEQGTVRQLLEQKGTGNIFSALCEESGDMDAIKALAGAR